VRGELQVTTMKMRRGSIIALTLFFTLVSASPVETENKEDDTYEYDTEDGDDKKSDEEVVLQVNPKFVTSAENILVNEGENIRLPCLVDRLEGFVMLWKRGTEIITVASQVIDKRVRLDESTNGNYLVIAQSTPGDAGEYSCQISAYNPTELTHTVRIRSEPVISTLPSQEVVVVAGEDATLTCRVEAGSPTPSLSWVREGEAGVLEAAQGVLTLHALNRHQGGVYTCRADNGFGPRPVTASVRVEVHYAPHIAVEHKLVETGYGETQELVCTVHAQPKAKVTWWRDGRPLNTTIPGLHLTSSRHRHSLSVLSISSEKLGQYQCRAGNSVGQAEKTLTIAGHASQAVISSPGSSDTSDEYTLEWRVSSVSAVEMFRVEVQKEGEEREDAAWVVNEVELHDLEEEEEKEENVEGPKKKKPKTYHGSLALKDLHAASRYRVRVSSRNAFGFNVPEEDFIFATKGAEPWQQPSVLTASSPPHLPSLLLLPVTLLLTFPLIC